MNCYVYRWYVILFLKNTWDICTANFYILCLYDLFHILPSFYTLMDPWNVCMHLSLCMFVWLYVCKYVWTTVSKIVSTSTSLVSPDPFPPSPSTSAPMKTLDPQPPIFQHPWQKLNRIQTERGPWWHWTSSCRRYSNGILLWLVVQFKYRSSNKKLRERTRSV